MTTLRQFDASASEAGSQSVMLKAVFYVALPTIAFVLLFWTAFTHLDFYHASLERETGWLEISHIILPLIAAGMALRLVLKFRKDRQWTLMAIAGLAVLAGLFIAGEEASYGQHFFKWKATGVFEELNDQQETNLHNIGTWFDQKPRALLEVITILAGLVVPFMQERVRGWLPRVFKPFVTGFWFMPIAILIQLSEVPKRLGLMAAGYFPAVRYSEIQECFLYYFLILALWHVAERYRLARAAGEL
ncbi:hypothetical protein H2509_19565 [Stappia sp. F7233]|uniref:Uncharacterized protein n=1 Tax=Stappia albiluteola TaxID=2758565 RepID=A0A839AK15_9HYPH|nr:hypothetical protein [Stappia albiluteola]MBA5779334.1 hypothetical protein [Stappia albiluteola]